MEWSTIVRYSVNEDVILCNAYEGSSEKEPECLYLFARKSFIY